VPAFFVVLNEVVENENMNGVHFLFSNMELFAIIEVQDLDRKDEFLLEEKMGRRERKKMQSRRAILEAAISEFSKKGYKETSVADIMSAADFGIGTFYNYFSSKEELLFSLLSRLGETIRMALTEARAAERTSLELLEVGAITDFSYSAIVEDYAVEKGEEGEIRHLTKLDLWEAGPCLRGANPLAKLKSQDAPETDDAAQRTARARLALLGL